MADILEAVNIQWHPGFYGAAELEFLSNKGDLEFQREYNLSKEPIRMDMLIIKKLADVRIKNELGHIFKKYNNIYYLYLLLLKKDNHYFSLSIVAEYHFYS